MSIVSRNVIFFFFFSFFFFFFFPRNLHHKMWYFPGSYIMAVGDMADLVKFEITWSIGIWNVT